MINLKSKTQQTQQASALAYGVGLPTSDGGAGAAANALRTVAGSAAHIGNVIKTRENAVQKASSERVGSLVGLEYERRTADINQATKLGQWDKVKNLTDERTAWANSIDPNSETYRTPDKHPELNNDHSSSLTQGIQNRVAQDDIRIRSNLATSQLFATVEQRYEVAGDAIKDAASVVSDGKGVPAHSVQSLMAGHRDAFVATSEHKSEVLSEGAQKIQDTQLKHFTDVFVMGQKYSSNIVATKASIPVFFEALEKNKDLYSEGVYKQVVGSLNKLNAEVNKPNSDAVTQANNAIKHTQTDLAQTPVAMNEGDVKELVNTINQSLGLAESATTGEARQAHLSKAHWAETMFKFSNPETVQALLDWRDSNPTGSSIPFLETLENFNSGRLAKEDMTKLTQYADGLVAQATKNEALYGDHGRTLVADSSSVQTSIEANKAIVDALALEGTKEDKLAQMSKSLSNVYPQELIPPNQGHTSFEGVEIMAKLIDEDTSISDMVIVSQAFSNLWGRDKTAAFTLASQDWENPNLASMGLMAEVLHRSITDPETAMSRIQMGYDLRAEVGQKKEMGILVDKWRDVQSLVEGRDRKNFNKGFLFVSEEVGYGYTRGVINAANTGGAPETAVFMESYVRGIIAEQVRANPDMSAEDLAANVDIAVAKDVTIITDSDGHHQVLWTKSSQSAQDYVSPTLNWVDWYAKERVTQKEHADLRRFNAINNMEEGGHDLVDLLMQFNFKKGQKDGSLGSLLSDYQSRFGSGQGEGVIDFSNIDNNTYEEYREHLVNGYFEGNKIIRVNPMGGSVKSVDSRSLQVWSPEENRYVDVVGSDGIVITTPEHVLESMSNNEGVKRMNYINGGSFHNFLDSLLPAASSHGEEEGRLQRAKRWDLSKKESATNILGFRRRDIDEVN